jgi:hypothetical protein
MSKDWTPEEIAKLRALFRGKATLNEMAGSLDRSVKEILDQLSALGLLPRRD